MQITDKLRAELLKNADEAVRLSGKRFFKEEVRLHGVKTPLAQKIGKTFFNDFKQEKSKAEIFALCEKLWQSGYLEEQIIACDWAYGLREKYEPADWEIFAGWINNYVSNWASCDTLCNHSVGHFTETYPIYVSGLKTLAKSANRWAKRASAVSLVIPARKGLFLDDIFEIATILLQDPDDLVQKGYGWMLKAAAEAHQQAVFDFVIANKENMPRTALRYAIEKMPPELKAAAMQK
ncbi:MAG: DNA alkylation repair protein [Dehalococcoidales bacterium]